jgi:ribosomal protein S12 methylthiotransferase
VDEAQRISDRCGQAMEFVLVAQDTTRYGTDFETRVATRYGTDLETRVATRYGAKLCAPATAAPGGSMLPELMRALARADGVRWIRVLYCYPDMVDERLAAEIAENPKALPYLDIPIQHASNGTLSRMGRRYSRLLLESMLESLRRAVPRIVLRTTVMVGFPGETDAEFEELRDFVEQARFDRLGAFEYSKEEGTPAALMPGQVPRRVARARKVQILAAQAPITAAKDAKRVGQECLAIVGRPIRGVSSGYNDVGMYEYYARTYAEAPDIDGNVRLFSNNILKYGYFSRVRITSSNKNGLQAIVIDAKE